MASRPSSVDAMTLRSVLLLLVLAACGGADTGGASIEPSTSAPATTRPVTTDPATTMPSPSSSSASGDGCAHVVDATVELEGTTATVTATVLSDDTGWDKYADAWEVRTPDGTVLGERVLTHPHENEQPFTRSLAGVEIAPDVAFVEIAAHDSVFGWCGETIVVELPVRS